MAARTSLVILFKAEESDKDRAEAGRTLEVMQPIEELLLKPSREAGDTLNHQIFLDLSPLKFSSKHNR